MPRRRADRARRASRTIGALSLGLLTALVSARAGAPSPRTANAQASSPDTATTVRVQARDNVFAPDRIDIDPGDTVVWENVGFRVHTVTSDTGEFESGNLSTGETFSLTFPDEGFFYYHCRHHGSRRTGMWGVVVVGDPPPPRARTKIHVPGDAPSIRKAVARAEPHSTVIIAPGTYRESVVVRVPDIVIRGKDRFRTVLHGRDRNVTGISVDGFGDVTIRDLTVRNYLGSGISLAGVDGYSVERVDLIKDRTVGLDIVGSHDGRIVDVFAWGSGDSGIRVAGCFACSTVIRSANVRWSYVGLSAINVTGLVVSASTFAHNGVGIATVGDADVSFAPGAGAGIVGNLVRNNNYSTVPAAGLSETSGIPFGTGIWVAGTSNAVVSSNEVVGHRRYGILVSRSLDRLLDPRNATVTLNELRGIARFDLAWDGTGSDDCFERNVFDGPTGPPNIEATYPCGARPFTGSTFAPVYNDVVAALALNPDRPQHEPPEPRRGR